VLFPLSVLVSEVDMYEPTGTGGGDRKLPSEL
jgi:hypothetical protein